jgi:hypothetical protein
MNLRIARFLLLLTVMGNLAPAALALAAPATHACCLRKSAHPCHESATTTAEHSVLRSADCCNHDCCRGVTTARWAYAQSPVSAQHQHIAENYSLSSDPRFLLAAIRGLQLTRGPPPSPLA